jgi:hypothetical protein
MLRMTTSFLGARLWMTLAARRSQKNADGVRVHQHDSGGAVQPILFIRAKNPGSAILHGRNGRNHATEVWWYSFQPIPSSDRPIP